MAAPLLPWWSSNPNITEQGPIPYGSDTTRVAGLGFGAPVPTTVFNSFLYQFGVALGALQSWCDFKNYTCNDAVGVLTTALENIACLADQQENGITVDSSHLSPNLDVRPFGDYGGPSRSGFKFFRITMGANAVAPTVSGIVPGIKVVMEIQQSSGGGWTWPWPSAFKGAAAIGSTAGQITIQKFIGTPDGNLRAVAPAKFI